MEMGLLRLEFYLEACHSLKEKRHRLAGLKDKLGREPNLAMSEADFHDQHQRAEWWFVALASDKRGVDKLLQKVEDFSASRLDAVISQRQREWI